MTTKAATFATEVLDQAVDTFDAALKSGVRIQEDLAQWWAESLGDAGSVQEWQKKIQELAGEAIPMTQKNTEEALKAIDQGCKDSLELVRKAFEATKTESVADAQAKMQELWEASLKTMRTNAEALVQANTTAMSAWADFARKSMNGKAAPAKAPVKPAK